MSEWMAERRTAGESIAAGLVGLPEAQAFAAARARGCRARVVRRDGKTLARRGSLVPGRINLDVSGGTVTAARIE